MTHTATKPLALIVGVGNATGKAVCTELASHYRLAMVARSTNVIGSLATTLEQAGAYPCDVTNRDAWVSTLKTIVAEMGLPDYILVNTEGGGWGEYMQIDVADFSNSFDVNVVSLLLLIQALFPDGVAEASTRSNCRIVISSSPAAYLSIPLFLGIAPSRAAQRVLAETLDEAMDNVDFSILSIDGAINEPSMRKAYPHKDDDFFIKPAAIATYIRTLFEDAPFERIARITTSGN